MVTEEVQERPVVVAASLVGGDVDLGWRLARSFGRFCVVVVASICGCYYRCPSMVETKVQGGALVVAVASEDVGSSFPVEP